MDNSSRKEHTPTTNAESSVPSSPGQKQGFLRRKSLRFLSVIRRVSTEWICFVLKIKLATKVSYSDEEALDLLFESSDDDLLGRSLRQKRCCNFMARESQFAKDFKKCGLLDAYYESCQDGILKLMPAAESRVPLYRALDVQRLRDALTISASSKDELVPTPSESVFKDRILAKDENLGNALWEIRRARWLSLDDNDHVEEKVEQRAAELSLKHISRDLYPRIYRDLVEKAKLLKPGKRVNLEDMVMVINAGWVHEKVWESASKGLG